METDLSYLEEMKRDLSIESVENFVIQQYAIKGQPKPEPDDFKLLHNATTVIDGKEVPSILVLLSPFQDIEDTDCSQSLNFTWEITKY